MTVERQLTPDTPITLTAAELQDLLRSAGGAMPALPPGAYRTDDGIWRDVLEPTGRTRPIRGPDGEPTGRFASVERKVARRVLLVQDLSPQGLLKAKRDAQRADQDVYHPRYGWLRHGVKREQDVPENLGQAASRLDLVYSQVPDPEELDPVTLTADEGAVVTEPGLPDELEPVGDGPAEPVQAADEASTRDPKGRFLRAAPSEGKS